MTISYRNSFLAEALPPLTKRLERLLGEVEAERAGTGYRDRLLVDQAVRLYREAQSNSASPEERTNQLLSGLMCAQMAVAEIKHRKAVRNHIRARLTSLRTS